jgi:hypothetical protein
MAFPFALSLITTQRKERKRWRVGTHSQLLSARREANMCPNLEKKKKKYSERAKTIPSVTTLNRHPREHAVCSSNGQTWWHPVVRADEQNMHHITSQYCARDSFASGGEKRGPRVLCRLFFPLSHTLLCVVGHRLLRQVFFFFLRSTTDVGRLLHPLLRGSICFADTHARTDTPHPYPHTRTHIAEV